MQSFYALYYPSSVKKYTHFLFVEQQVKILPARMVKAFIQALIPHSFFLAFIPPFLTPHFRCQIEGGKCLLIVDLTTFAFLFIGKPFGEIIHWSGCNIGNYTTKKYLKHLSDSSIGDPDFKKY